MEDTLFDRAKALAALLLEHKGEDVALLDLRKMAAWTDFFVVATVTSSTHAEALIRHIKDYCQEQKIEIRPHRGINNAAGASEYGLWLLVDLGSIVIHLMDKKARDFYNLESLWT
jgi:ribosome-associated protein